MNTERTLAIIKPDAVQKGVIGAIVNRIEENELKVVAIKMLQLDKRRAAGFYAVHKVKSFFEPLVGFMTSGPVVVLALEGKEAIKKWRDVMGPTDSTKAPEGTIRGDYGTDIQNNAVHGSDAPETAKFEVSYFFEPQDVVEYEWM
ncbi:MAG: nucleoside-diphosphate kinase [Deltaproteobacteria bacterium CG11_big_fil_rev_8_21_14_0_20_49_13]|nr:MAG: nucleoside-diphosphate kinase [Deltaproteobacteria bacterium CG11_big_fil_rev_8_21_14_0_20_49_13]